MVRKFRPYAAVLGLSIAVNLYLWFDRDRVARQVSSAAASVSHAGEARSNAKSDPAHLGSVSHEPEKRVAAPSNADASGPSCETQLSLARAEVRTRSSAAHSEVIRPSVEAPTQARSGNGTTQCFN